MASRFHCAFCFQRIQVGDKIRTANNKTGKLHPQWHVYPDGGDLYNNPIRNACKKQHGDHEHLHESCVASWCDKFNMPIPEPFEAGDWERLERDLA